MSLRPTFMGFETMRKAISASQKALDITGNNIANAHTVGYSRQRVDFVSVNSPSGGLRYNTSRSLAGQGVDAAGVTQIRDSFLDKRYRELNADSAEAGTASSILTDIENVLDVIDTDGFNKAYQSFKDSLSKFATDSPNRVELANITLQSAQQMVQSIHSYDTKLSQIQDQTKFEMQTGVNRVSEIFKQIADLNDQITNGYVSSNDIVLENSKYKANTTYGPNELKDQRNTLLDELSNYGNIRVTDNENGSIKVNFANTEVVNDKKYSVIEMKEHSTGTLSLEIDGNTVNTNDAIPDKLLSSGSLRGYLNMYNGAGTYSDDVAIRQNGVKTTVSEVNTILTDIKTAGVTPTADQKTALKDYGFVEDGSGNMTLGGQIVVSADGTTVSKVGISIDGPSKSLGYKIVNTAGVETAVTTSAGKLNEVLKDSLENNFTSNSGIVYYRKVVDALANTLARNFNDASSDNNFTDAGGNTIIRAMFSPSGANEEITAGNLKISDSWLSDASMITKNVAWVDSNDHTKGITSKTEAKYELWSGNIAKLQAITAKNLSFSIDGPNIADADKTYDQRSCTFDKYVSIWSNKLGQDIEYQKGVYSAADTMASNVQDSRDQVMSIDVNEEGVNMMNFQKWFNASSRMMTTLDEALDTIISSMGLVGR